MDDRHHARYQMPWAVKIGKVGLNGDIFSALVRSFEIHDRYRAIAGDQSRLRSCKVTGGLKAERVTLRVSSKSSTRLSPKRSGRAR